MSDFVVGASTIPATDAWGRHGSLASGRQSISTLPHKSKQDSSARHAGALPYLFAHVCFPPTLQPPHVARQFPANADQVCKNVTMTAVASKPAIPKSKRPAAPQLQTSLNGAKPFQASLSPSSAPKRLPSQKNPVANSAATNGAVNGAARPNRQRKDTQRPGEQYGRLQRLQTRGSAMDGGSGLKSASKKFPEPYGLNVSS